MKRKRERNEEVLAEPLEEELRSELPSGRRICEILNANPQGQPRRTYHAIARRLELRNLPEVLAYIDVRLSLSYTRLPWQKRALRLSPAFADRVNSILEALLSNIQQRTSFPEQLRRYKGASAFRLSLSIWDYCSQKYASAIPRDVDPFDWFFENCDLEMATEIMRAHLCSMRCVNKRVKSSMEIHHAQNEAKTWNGFYKVGLRKLLANYEQIKALSFWDVLGTIPNERIAADPMTRRTLTEHELDRMRDACKGNPRHVLLLTILCEIGLRRIALTHLRYSMICDEHGHPRHACAVPEKMKKTRHFVTSLTLKQAIQSYRHDFFVTHPGFEGDFYIFHTSDPMKPPSSGQFCNNFCKSIAKKAGIAQVSVHPHMFRHTIVGMLMDAGNSIDVVSRYMGHGTSIVTGQHYWVSNIQQISDSLHNPLDGSHQEQLRREETENLELKLLYEKRNAAMQIIYKYNVILGQIADRDGSAQEVKAAIFEAMPNLEEMLRTINESVSSTLSVSGGQSVYAEDG